MACCALAAFLVSQLLLALDFLRERMLGMAAAPIPESPNAAWRLGDAAPDRRVRLASPRRLGLALAGGVLTLAVASAALETGSGHRPHALQIPYLCTSSAPATVE
jgi:hypothetical protein